MSDEELCEMFGTSLEEVGRGVAKVEEGDYSDFDFSRAMPGRPMEREKMEMITATVPASRVAAMRRVTDRLGISRAEFVRTAIDNELMSMA
jgi:hypothetical protein